LLSACLSSAPRTKCRFARCVIPGVLADTEIHEAGLRGRDRGGHLYDRGGAGHVLLPPVGMLVIELAWTVVELVASGVFARTSVEKFRAHRGRAVW
jgi:hypothetical protein